MRTAPLHLAVPFIAYGWVELSSVAPHSPPLMFFASMTFLLAPHLLWLLISTASKVSERHKHLTFFAMDGLFVWCSYVTLQSTSSGNAWLPYYVYALVLMLTSMIAFVAINRREQRND
jgi:hypothetical protein